MKGLNASKFLLIFTFYCVLDISFAKRVIVFDSVSCLSSNKSMVFFECYVKPITGDIATLNFVIHFLKTVSDAFFAYDVTLKTGNRGFRSVVNGKDIDLCKLLDGSKKSSVLNYGLNLVRRHFPEGSLHPCPYTLQYDVTLKVGNRGFRSFVNGKDIDICKFLDGSKTSSVMKYALNLVGKYFPKEALHPCPFLPGSMEFKNILSGSPETKMTIFPPATYMIKLKYYNKEDDNIGSLNVTCTSKNV
ncbi:CLUMA_CG001437, isoform A [Clunio marinus]|uniref:CLUMA_CG001437, isoform A n=1 Tax=Clunio marinus TaxID=568069 RepID=A0A1J1HN31_9DIPT|nr:CLUMA_CG001437, isoform A [Clunio marinus]